MLTKKENILINIVFMLRYGDRKLMKLFKKGNHDIYLNVIGIFVSNANSNI